MVFSAEVSPDSLVNVLFVVSEYTKVSTEVVRGGNKPSAPRSDGQVLRRRCGFHITTAAEILRYRNRRRPPTGSLKGYRLQHIVTRCDRVLRRLQDVNGRRKFRS